MCVNLRVRKFCGVDQDATHHGLATSWSVFSNAEITFKRMDIWLCGVCFKTHSLRTRCRHDRDDIVDPPNCGDSVVRFILYDFPVPPAPTPLPGCVDASEVHVFTISSLDCLLLKGLRTIKSIRPKCCLVFSRVLKGALDAEVSSPDALSC